MSDEEKEELSELLKSKKENTSECDDKECNCDSSDEANNENRVVEMFRAGKTPEAIARDLQLGVGQVTMILKFKKEI